VDTYVLDTLGDVGGDAVGESVGDIGGEVGGDIGGDIDFGREVAVDVEDVPRGDMISRADE